jgi:hypothetical protein
MGYPPQQAYPQAQMGYPPNYGYPGYPPQANMGYPPNYGYPGYQDPNSVEQVPTTTTPPPEKHENSEKIPEKVPEKKTDDDAFAQFYSELGTDAKENSDKVPEGEHFGYDFIFMVISSNIRGT